MSNSKPGLLARTPFLRGGHAWAKLWSAAAILAFALVATISAPAALQQNPDTMSPDASATKAKSILQQLIQALGGDAYLHLKDSDCTGRASNFGLSGDLSGYTLYHELRILPDKQRVEYTKTGVITNVYAGDKGWTLDKSGVDDIPAADLATFQGQAKNTLSGFLRYRLSDPDLYYHYAGQDVVDLKPSDWVEITDSEERAFKIAVDQSTHLPVRTIVTTKNPNTGDTSEEETIYSEWHSLDGVQTPFQTSRERDGKRSYQGFIISCKYNSGVSPDLFTKESLEQKYAQLGGKKQKNQKK
jgi:hypothetical protein